MHLCVPWCPCAGLLAEGSLQLHRSITSTHTRSHCTTADALTQMHSYGDTQIYTHAQTHSQSVTKPPEVYQRGEAQRDARSVGSDSRKVGREKKNKEGNMKQRCLQ